MSEVWTALQFAPIFTAYLNLNTRLRNPVSLQAFHPHTLGTLVDLRLHRLIHERHTKGAQTVPDLAESLYAHGQYERVVTERVGVRNVSRGRWLSATIAAEEPQFDVRREVSSGQILARPETSVRIANASNSGLNGDAVRTCDKDEVRESAAGESENKSPLGGRILLRLHGRNQEYVRHINGVAFRASDDGSADDSRRNGAASAQVEKTVHSVCQFMEIRIATGSQNTVKTNVILSVRSRI